ncbi:hypothetical protein [Bosea sp. 117]|uniref:lysozyme inhibitor LprI family protein n=1 Tax=Bosea sp. 117 TaxID=1125973 RepID=UPI000B1907FE|nr:hypothetical protein [Bosea sp. 117]
MSARRLAAALGLLGLIAAPHAAGAASFDCAKAAAPDERAICADATLSALDSEMGGLWYAYDRVPMLMGGSGTRRDEARAFLAARAQCGANAGCLLPLYRNRVATLQLQIDDAMETLTRQANAAPAPPAPAPQPVMDQVGAFFAQCSAAGGKLQGNAWPAMMSADIDHDGRLDYVLNTQTLRCDGAPTAYCAAADGCDIAVSLSRASYAPTKLRGVRPTLMQGADLATFYLRVDKKLCSDVTSGTACWGTWKWNGTALAPSYKARQR